MRRALIAMAVVGSVTLAACGTAVKPATTTTTTAPTPTTTTAPAPTVGATVYFLHAGTVDQPGPFLLPVWKAGVTTPRTALAALLAGPPTPAQNKLASPAISTAVPAGTRLLGVTVAGGTATVDLSGGYAEGGGSTTMLARLAQVVYTATQFPGIDRVVLRLDGRAVATFSAEGIAIGGGMTRDFFSGTGLLPGIFVDHPALGEPVHSPFWLSGVALDVPGATFTYELTRGGEERLARGRVTTAAETGWSTFRQRVAFSVSGRQRIDLVVYTGAATSPTHLLQIPFYLEPSTAAEKAACSATGLPATVPAETGLPPAVAAMRRDIAAAAVRCDYAALVELGNRHGAGLRVSWGGPVDAASMWREAETGGHGLPPMWYLRTLLDLPYGLNREVPPGKEVYTWPAAAAGPRPPTEAQLQDVAAAGLYTLDELHDQMRSIGGYVGYRVFIAANGDWQAFVAGD